jgi:outer membrane receptor protein involved in Fe transport
MFSRHPKRAALLFGLTMAFGAASAPAAAAEPQALPEAAAAKAPEEASPFAKQAVEEEDLQRIAGREDVSMEARSNHAATVSGNSVGNNSRTGEVSIADNAFQNLSGLSVINVNSGNNVGINAAINVNISMSPQL